MKYFIILGLIAVCAFSCSIAMMPPNNKPAALNTPHTTNTLVQDLDTIVRMVPIIPIRRLATRYLLNDDQFQAFVRIINSNDAYITQMRFRSQPEVMNFMNWVRNQIALSGGELQLEESEELLSIVNRTPFDSNTVFGWQGLVNEFLLYYPEDMIRGHIQMKVAQNGIFAQFVQRLQALKPIYDRITALPEAQRLATALEAKGINISALDNFIRNQFVWQNSRTVPTTDTSTVAEETAAIIADEVSLTTGLPISLFTATA